MPRQKRESKRRTPYLRYRKIFVLAVEGRITEPQYFAMFNDQNSVIRVQCLRAKHSSPAHVLNAMEKHLEKEQLNQSDEAWLVVDKDIWTDAQLSQLHRWSQQADNYGFALSNPKFEFWLLLHFTNGDGIGGSSKKCSERLKRYLPGYDKEIDRHKITDSGIVDAIIRAKQLDNPPCNDWPRKTGTTVYRLVENILESHKNQ